MDNTQISIELPPNVDVTKARVAFGDRALPKLNRELKGDDLLLKQQALNSLTDLIRDPPNVAAAIETGIVETLRDLLPHSDSLVRILSAKNLFHIAGQSVGRQAILAKDVVKALAVRFDDTDVNVRMQIHDVLARTTKSAEGIEAVFKEKLVPVLVKKLEAAGTESPTVIAAILDELHDCMKVDTKPCLDINAMATFTALLQSSNEAVQQGAATAIKDLSVPLAGKDQAVSCGCLAPLVTLLETKASNPGLQAACASALMTVTITTSGKYDAIKAGACPALARVLCQSKDESVLLNVIKAITSIAEANEGRTEFQKVVGELQKLTEFKGKRLDADAVARSAQIAIKTITWKP